MSSSESGNRRISTRQQIRYAPYRDLVIVYEGYSTEIPVRVPDLSVNGMFIPTSRPFAEGAVIKIRFRLTRSNCEVNARGEVCYFLPGVGIGVKFLEISPAARRAIEEELQIAELRPQPEL